MPDNTIKSLNHLVTKGLRIIIAVGCLLLVLGIVLLSLKSSTQPWKKKDFENAFTIDYTYCTNDNGIRCFDIQKPDDLCVCYWTLNLTSPFEGDISVYYELESFNISEVAKQPGYFQSRDDNQLKGNLTEHVSDACGAYAYNDGRPIAPCGAIADAMFNDTISFLQPNVPLLLSGMINPEDKAGFHNPENSNLNIAFQNFSRPINWIGNITQLDPGNSDNNAFQNERFIGWMKTEWTRKPWYRIDHSDPAYRNGLPLGNYILSIEYFYPLSRYNGTRKVLLVKSIQMEGSSACFGWGLAVLIIGLMLLLVAAGMLVAPKVKSKLEAFINVSETNTPVAVPRKEDSPLKDKASSSNTPAGTSEPHEEDPHAEKNPLNH